MSRRMFLVPGLSRGNTLSPYYLNDVFTTSDAAPVNNPHTAEPGPGTEKVTDSGNKTSITSGTMTWASPGAGTADPGMWDNVQRTLAAGLAVGAKISYVAAQPNLRLGWAALQSGNVIYGLDTNASAGGTLAYFVGNGGVVEALANALPAGYHKWWVIAREGGGYFGVIDNRLVVPTRASLGANAYAAIVTRNTLAGGFTQQAFKVIQLTDSAWSGVFPTALMELSLTSPAIGTYSYTHEAKFTIEFDTTASTVSFSIIFDVIDENNLWLLDVVSGRGTLTQYVAGVGTVQATSSVGAFATSSRFVMTVTKDDITINLATNSSLTAVISFTGTHTPTAGSGTVVVSTGLALIGIFKGTIPTSAQNELARLIP